MPPSCRGSSGGENGEQEDRAERDDVEGQGVESKRGGAATKGVGGGDGADDDHGDGDAKTEQAERHVPLDPARGDERGLGEEDDHPERHNGTVDVDDPVGQRGGNHAGEVVGPGKAVEHGGPEQQHHGGKEHAVCLGLHVCPRHNLLAQRIGCHGKSS